jgi:hypothetical protein
MPFSPPISLAFRLSERLHGKTYLSLVGSSVRAHRLRSRGQERNCRVDYCVFRPELRHEAGGRSDV